MELFDIVIFCLNALSPSPYVGGGGLILRQIVTEFTANYTKHYHLQFGEFAQVHESHDNTMQERAMGGIALRPTGNAQG